jgi:predicted glycosyltransferase
VPNNITTLNRAVMDAPYAPATRPSVSHPDTYEAARGKRVWIDLDNSPHVPFFLPIIDELNSLGIEVVLTARNAYQVCELLKFYDLHCKVIGGHSGSNKILKVLVNLARTLQLAPTALSARPDLAVSHGSRAQVLICKALRIPTLMMHDYEFTTKTGFLEPEWIFMPEVIPNGAMSRKANRVLKYPGLKEDVYVPRFTPDPAILEQLQVVPGHILVTLRPPATEAHYHNPESSVLFDATLRYFADKPQVKGIVLPRNARQGQQLRQQWADLVASGRIVIPDYPVDGLNLIWFSDLVVSGGGTMNREAAALGVPVYSVFRGKIGAVDQYLVRDSRLTLIEKLADIPSKIKLVHWGRPEKPNSRGRKALPTIIRNITAILAGVTSFA